MSEGAPSEKQRRVRPWIAAMLTFIGWGLGAYYSGKTKLAIKLAVLNIVFAILFGFALFSALFLDVLPPILFPAPGSITYLDGVVSLAAIPVAIFVFTRVSGVRHATSRGIAGLFGYLAIWALPVLVSAGLVLTARTFIVQPFHMPSGSMRPTIEVNDFFVVDKMRFRDRSVNPDRGDLVVFRNPKDGNKDYISRIIGMPGDVVTIDNGEVSINGKMISRQFDSLNSDRSANFRETLDNGTSYLTIDHGEGPLDNVGPYKVPPAHYFFMGDNRDRAQDSRVLSAVGYISRDDLRGPVIKIIQNKE